MRKTLVLLAVGMTLAACRDPEPHPHLVKAEGVQVQIEDPPIYSRSGSLARIRMPMANDPAYAEASQALMDIVAGREVAVDESSAGLRVSVGGEDLARAVVAAGWARPLDASAEPELARAEAEARQARRGGWSPAYRELAHRWLRARALDVSMSDAHLTDAAARMQLRWYAAKGFAKDQLALFEVDFDDRDAAGTRPSCAHQVSAHAAATLTAGPASARSAFAEGAELARVVESGTAACEAWRVAGNALVRGDERRPSRSSTTAAPSSGRATSRRARAAVCTRARAAS
ncbi:MAG: hypothetical protein U1F43_21475 [Myxococcota bacterium]